MMKLICPECRKENESERIYCHECGARLDRSVLAKAKEQPETSQQKHKRVKAMFSPHQARIRQGFFKTSKVILAALLTATVIEMALPPDLPPAQKTLGMPVQIAMDLESATLNHSATPLSYTQEQANAYLAYALKTRPGLSGMTRFERAAVKFDQDACRLIIGRSLLGYSFYVGGDYHIAVDRGSVTAQETGGHIGRMPIHPQLMKYSDFLFRDVAAALQRERKALEKASRIEFRPQAVTITP